MTTHEASLLEDVTGSRQELTVVLPVRHLRTSTRTRVCAYLLRAEQPFESPPAATATSARFTLRRSALG